MPYNLPTIGKYYLQFPPGETEESARTRYLARFGEPPAQVTEQFGMLYLGPVNMDDDHHYDHFAASQ